VSTPRPIRTVLIANRGEIAVRIIRTCRERGIRTVAVYSDADRTMPHVLLADEAYRIGPPPSRESYLLTENILDVARRAGADAIHPGYGFLSERPEFAEAVSQAGFVFIGPPGSAIRAMGDKTAARSLMRRAGVPTVPGSEGPVATEAEAEVFCSSAGYPVLIKAAAGGGGKGMRVVQRREELAAALAQAQSEARSAFGDSRVYLEKYLEEPRHIEFQILADEHGNTIHLGERECSIQRRHQKIIEESPSVVVDEETRHRMGAVAVRAAQACGYVNAGTIEFLMDKTGAFYFLEMNTRLQVEHPVTELRTGLDLVAEQLHIAEGNTLGIGQDDVRMNGHAIECRICAEDPANNFLPSTGTIVHLAAAQGPGIREDRGVETGQEISVYYDSLISKVIAWGPTRSVAIDRMERTLREYAIAGVATNIPVCLFVLGHLAFRSGTFDTGFLPKYLRPEIVLPPEEHSHIAAAILAAWLEHRGMSIVPGNGADSGSDRTPGKNNGSSLEGWKARQLEMRRGGTS
jgi:acetyl-CoA carboxylase, biotin carboxylase subunit